MLCVLRNLEEDGESGPQSLMLEKGWWQGLEQLLVRQKDMCAGAQLPFPLFIQSGPQGTVLPAVRAGLPNLGPNLDPNHRRTRRYVSMEMPHLIKFTLKIS